MTIRMSIKAREAREYEESPFFTYNTINYIFSIKIDFNLILYSIYSILG